MSGHSKWSTIKRKKGEKDGARAKVFTKISREIIVCIKEHGADPSSNSKLATLIAKAKANNIPNDNIDRLIKKAAGEGDKNNYENCVYEGYGPNGVALIVDCLTDNRNRTAGDVRHYFDKFGGNLGTTGCVSFMFNLKGIIVLDNEDEDIDEDRRWRISWRQAVTTSPLRRGALRLLPTLTPLQTLRKSWREWDIKFCPQRRSRCLRLMSSSPTRSR